MSAFRIAKAKVAGSNPVFRSKLPGFRVVSGSGHFHGRRSSRRRRRFTTVRTLVWEATIFRGLRHSGIVADIFLVPAWNIGGTSRRRARPARSFSKCDSGPAFIALAR